MRFQVMVTNGKRRWWEEFVKETDDADRCAREMVDYFNNTLRPNELPRRVLFVEELDEEETEHDWVKSCLVTQLGRSDSRGHDTYRCERCGITGKRYGLDSCIERDRKYQAKKYRTCRK